MTNFQRNKSLSLRDIVRNMYYKLASDKFIINRSFKKRLGREVNFETPVMYNDKLQWLKLNWRDPLATKCADKYKVREYISEKIGNQYLNDLYGVYESVEEIDINSLPTAFVLKGTHGSGFNFVCKNKNEVKWDEKKKEMDRWLSTNYYLGNREWVYKDIKPRIICEKFIEQDNDEELRDYRFFCFNGEPKFITVDLSINDKKKTRRNLYDLEWNLMDEEITYPKELDIKINKPEKLDEMIKLSKILSSEFPHARVDFYYIDGNIIFGEITFYHQSGMGVIRPTEFELKMGDWLKLPKSHK
ncbi:glycosyl transferase [Oceanobacillus luteolus]|uniref:ATP-grasp fold amidoligase family protein n=1 Tax=Oceanobacillus luteolus TaxID=1274358 RepID=UPI00204012BF|nr:ATP-grasp fold amidoligase family protein [Oceanobacillus luteolus]MCM3741801.1 glycosyl transferase [Oceanobacillus luteolus]